MNLPNHFKFGYTMRGSVPILKSRGICKPFALFTSLLLIVAMFLSACSSNNEAESKTTTKQSVRIGYQKNGPLIILKNLGTLEERLKSLDYSVEWFEFQAGPALLEALNAGSIDFGRTGDSPPIFAQSSGATLKYIAVGNPKFKGSGILVKNDSPIKTLVDLKGKTIGFAKGSSSHYLLVKALEKADLLYEDITPAYLSPGDARVAFEQGNIDAWVVWDPFTADTEMATDARLLVNGEGLTSDRDYFLASSDFAKHSDISKIIIEEIQHSSEWANEHPEELTTMLSSILGIDESSMRLAVERRVYGVQEITAEIIKEQQEIADTFYELKIIPNKINVEDSVYSFEKDEGN
ncbi:sulfonate ABC transporter substrate-binding protein [Psychrobacillus sp. FJAT-51614]|uniref:Sulfonate ABC transporter substrate-binding protein n=1 Tax=Psychrobacillus mangrovi TaxID=3117745 RepID=A0ABU8F6U6_9BACI